MKKLKSKTLITTGICALGALVVAGCVISDQVYKKIFTDTQTSYGKNLSVLYSPSSDNGFFSRKGTVKVSLKSSIGQIQSEDEYKFDVDTTLLPFYFNAKLSPTDADLKSFMEKNGLKVGLGGFALAPEFKIAPVSAERDLEINALPEVFKYCLVKDLKLSSKASVFSDISEGLKLNAKASGIVCKAPDPSGALTEGAALEDLKAEIPLESFYSENGIGFPAAGLFKAKSVKLSFGYFKANLKGLELSRVLHDDGRESDGIRFDLGTSRDFSSFMMKGSSDRVDEPRFRIGRREGEYYVKLKGPIFNNRDNVLLSTLVKDGYMSVKNNALESRINISADFTGEEPEFTIKANGKSVSDKDAASLFLGQMLENSTMKERASNGIPNLNVPVPEIDGQK